MPHPLTRNPGKIVAVHLAYRSRAAERGRLPAHPSYFLKPPSSLAGSGDDVVRPAGCELLGFEGEIALVVGGTARGVRPAEAWRHIAYVTAANDFGVYELRYADRGSNVRSKGPDGFTPLGPRLLDARTVDPAGLRLRTWVNGELAQDALTGDELLFGFDQIIADLARLSTLEPGDVILTGTPAGASVVEPGDVVEVEVSAGNTSTGRLTSPIVGATGPLAEYGAMPRQDESDRADAYGAVGVPAAGPSKALIADLARVSTATLSSLLRKRGLDNVNLGLRPTRPDLPMVGPARTVRYLPLREDLFTRHGNGMNAQKRAIEQISRGEVLVIDAREDDGSGTIGDILALRAQVRGAAGVVTDGGLRDTGPVMAMDLPVYYGTSHPAVLGRRHVPWDVQVPVACAGVLVQPGDLIVGDEDGLVLVPPELAPDIAADAFEQERQERFITEQVRAGHAVEGLYPLGPEQRQAYERWLTEEGRTS